MRSVEEWKGKDDDTAIPARVKLRIFRAAAGICAICKFDVIPRGGPAYDHIVPICNGGENRENNLQLLDVLCHKDKTKADVKQKSKDNRVMAKHLGIVGPKRKLVSRGFQKAQPQRSASRPTERRT